MSSIMHPSNDVSINNSGNENILDVIENVDPSRRKFLSGSVGGAALAAFTGAGLSSLTGEAFAYPTAPAPSVPITFTPVPPETTGLAAGGSLDLVTVPPGYSVQILAAWGDAIVGATTPNMNPSVPQTKALQERQFGMHNDGSHFFAFPAVGTQGLANDRGLFCVNHEYTDEGLIHHSLTAGTDAVTFERVQTSLAAHGVSIFETRKVNGKWEVIKNSPFNRRITGYTPMKVSGPAKGNNLMKTAADTAGENVLGTLNNCAAGYTPWGTYLTCEENFNGYFGTTGSYTPDALQNRYGVNGSGFGYRWHLGDPRFDLRVNPNEPNRHGWVVEIDPFNPRSVPVKRTALGRFKHESAAPVVAADNTVTVYMGCDERNEYIYKFVSDVKFKKGDMVNNRTILDFGTLYVAKFNADGTGSWLPLVWSSDGLLSPANGFANQGEVLIKARQAADRLGATMMDRPEWVAVHPTTGEVYVTLTNNTRRGTTPVSSNNPNGSTVAGAARPAVDAANPRVDNRYGHIIRFSEVATGGAPTTLEWEVFVLAGDKRSTIVRRGPVPAGSPAGTLGPIITPSSNYFGNINGETDSTADFGAPDGLWFDKDGRLWIQTDQQGDALGDWVNIGVNSMLCADPSTREIKRFLTTPPNCEVTGVVATPDNKAFFVGIQHPGEDWSGSFTQKSTWPDNGKNGPTTLSSQGAVKPRSAVFVVTKNDGGVIGT